MSTVAPEPATLPAGHGTAAAGAEQSEAAPSLYTDTRPIGAPFWLAQVLGVGGMFGLALAFSWLVTLLTHGLHPVSQLCECPSNIADFGPEAIFYEHCSSEVNSTWFQLHNAAPSNATHQVDGWFGTVDWTRDTLREQQGIGRAVIVEADVAPDVYECPQFRPFWVSPVDWVGVVILVLGYLGAAYGIATGTVRSTEVLADRVRVRWFGGGRTEVPLCALQEGPPKEHDLAGLPPTRSGALALKTTESVVFPKPDDESGTSTRLTDGTTETVRVEPSDTEAFLRALEEARGGAAQREHFFVDEMPSTSGATEAVHSYTPPHTVGYWVRVLPILALWWCCVDFGFKIALYGIQEVVQPGRPKVEGEFAHRVLALGFGSLIFLALVLVFGSMEYFNGVPSEVAVREDALVVRLDRGKACDQPLLSLAVPKAAIVSVKHERELDCFERLLRFPFQEMGGVLLTAKFFFVVKVQGKKTTVEKKVANDEQGMDVKVADTEVFYPSDREGFVGALRTQEAAEQRPRDGFEP